MKKRNIKAGKGGGTAGFLAIGLPLIAAVVIAMGGCATFQSITVTPPAKTVFGQGEKFTYEGLQVVGVTKKGEAKALSGEFWVTGYDPDRIGDQTITVNYREAALLNSQDFTATYTVTVIGVESIFVDQAPTAARQGMDIDRSALSITASYGEKIAPRPVQGSDPGVNISGYNKYTGGAQTVTVDYYGKTADFAVTVAVLAGIRITRPPARVSYFSGEELDLAGLETMGTWQGAGDAPVTPEYVSGFDANKQGAQTIIVEVQGKQASFTVTVKEPADPATWTPVTGAFAKNITGIAYGNGKFVAVGYDDKPNEGIIAYSTDGIAWTKASYPKVWEDGSRTQNVIDFRIDKILFGGDRFYVSGLSAVPGTSYVAAHNANFMTESSDGIGWSNLNNFGSDDVCTDIAYGNDNLVAVFDNGFIRIARRSGTARNGDAFVDEPLSWSPIPPPIKDGGGQPVWSWGSSFRCVFFDGNRFIVFDAAGRYVYIETRGNGQVGEETISVNGRSISEVVYGNGKYIGTAGSALGWSTDGITWTDADQKDEELRGISLNGVAYGFGMFVAVGSRGSIAYSRDGYVWTKVASSTFGSTDIRYVAYGNGKFLAVGDNGRTAYSNKID
jgi:hypothetical protein